MYVSGRVLSICRTICAAFFVSATSLKAALFAVITTLTATAALADLVAVPFEQGFIGTMGSSNRAADNVVTFSTLGISSSVVQQNSSSNVFESPTGNDVPVTLVLISSSQALAIPGNISWKMKQGNDLEVFGFTPSASASGFRDYTITYGSGQTLVLNAGSNYGLVRPPHTLSSLSINDGDDLSGSNDPVGVSELNAFLDQVLTARPYGPITVDSQTVYLSGATATPVITGSACLVTAVSDTSTMSVETISLTVDGTYYNPATYTIDAANPLGCVSVGGYTVSTVNWSLPTTTGIAAGTYDVAATITSTRPIFNQVSDKTINELTVVGDEPLLTLTKTLPVTTALSDGADVGDTLTYTITAENVGNVDTFIYDMTDALTRTTGGSASAISPAGTLTFQSCSLGWYEYFEAGETCSWSYSYTLTSADLAADTIENIATLPFEDNLGMLYNLQSASDGNQNTGTPSGSTYTGAPTARDILIRGLTATKTVTAITDADNDGVDSEGDVVNFSITLENTGEVDFTDVALSSDTLTRGTDGTGTALTLTWAAATTDNLSDTDLSVGELWTYTASYTLTQADIDAGGVSNIATFTATPRTGSTAITIETSTSGNTTTGTGNGSETVAALTAAPVLNVTKTVDTAVSGATYLSGSNANIVDVDANSRLSAGDRIYFEITAANEGNVTLTGVTLADNLTTNETPSSALTLTSGPTLTADTGTTGDTTLEVGDVWTYTAYYDLTQDDIDAGVGIANLATFTATPPSGTPFSVGSKSTGNTSGAGEPTTVGLTGTAAITGIKTVAITNDTGAAGLSLGDTVTYTITATNTGDVALTGVNVSSDTLSRGTSTLTTITDFDETDFTAQGSTSLAPDASVAFTATYVVTQDDVDAGGLSNTATVAGTPPSGSDVTDVTDDGDTGSGDTGEDPTRSTISGTAAITGIKTVAITNDTGAAGLSLGDTVTYTITATNTGDVALTGVNVSSDTLSRGTSTLTTIIGFDETDFTAQGSTSLAPGASVAFTATYVVTQDDVDAGGLSNTATVAGTPPSGSDVTDVTDDGDTGSGDTGEDPTLALITTNPAVHILKTVDDSALDDGVRAGDVLHYTITITNIGDVSLTGITLTDTLTDLDGNALTLDTEPTRSSGSGETLGIGAVWTYTSAYTLTAADIATGGVENIAQVSATGPDGQTVTAESKATGNSSNDGEGAPTATGFPGEINGTVYEYQVGVPDVTVYLLIRNAAGGYDHVIDPDTGDYMSVLTDADGNYHFVGLAPGVYAIQFNNPHTHSRPTATSTDGVEYENMIMDITVGAGAVHVHEDAFLIDPSGIVYDSQTFEPVSGAQVTLLYQASSGASATRVPDSWLNTNLGDENGMTTGADGEYTFFLDPATAQDGIYSLAIAKSNYRFESARILPLDGPHNAGVGGGVRPISADETTFEGMDTTYYLAFRMVFTNSAATSSNGVIYNHIPIDPEQHPLAEIAEDLTQILRDDLAATMSQQSRQMSGFSAGALDRLKGRDANSCAADIAKLLTESPIHFASASAVILPDSDTTLDRIAQLLETCTDAGFEVAGHTDDRASDSYNLTLSHNRASSVVTALADRGITDRLIARGYGESRPIADNATEKGRALNRRVVFVPQETEATTAPCQDSTDTQRDFTLHADDTGVTVDGSFNSESGDCAIDGWHIFSGATSYLETDDGIAQGMMTLNYRTERFKSDDQVSGWFVGGYASDNTISGQANGQISGYGLNAGLYGARRLQEDLFADYYLGAATGRHSFDLDFDRPLGTVNALGDYSYYALFAGGAISGSFDAGKLTLAPRIGVDTAWSPGGEADVVASRDGFEESGTLSTGAIFGTRFYGELGFEDLLLVSPETLSITPRLFCDQQFTSDAMDCGGGASINYETARKNAERTFGIALDLERTPRHLSYGLTVTQGTGFLGGQVDTSASVTRDGQLDLGVGFSLPF